MTQITAISANWCLYSQRNTKFKLLTWKYWGLNPWNLRWYAPVCLIKDTQRFSWSRLCRTSFTLEITLLPCSLKESWTFLFARLFLRFGFIRGNTWMTSLFDWKMLKMWKTHYKDFYIILNCLVNLLNKESNPLRFHFSTYWLPRRN